MSFLHKLGIGVGGSTSRGASLPVHSNSRPRTPGVPIASMGAARTPEMRKVLALEGAEPVGNPPDEFASQIRSELERWSKLIGATGIKAD